MFESIIKKTDTKYNKFSIKKNCVGLNSSVIEIAEQVEILNKNLQELNDLTRKTQNSTLEDLTISMFGGVGLFYSLILENSMGLGCFGILTAVSLFFGLKNIQKLHTYNEEINRQITKIKELNEQIKTTHLEK